VQASSYYQKWYEHHCKYLPASASRGRRARFCAAWLGDACAKQKHVLSINIIPSVLTMELIKKLGTPGAIRG
jgi:hypothetical protein